MTDRNSEHDAVGSLHDTEYFGEHFESSSFSRPSPRSEDKGKNLAIKITLILIAIIAFAIYARADDKRREKETRQMWMELYKGYSKEDWQRSKYYKGSRSSTTTYTPSSNSETTREKSTVPKKKKASESNDSLHVKDYRDPEDFYYDNYDDFFDYEDAEDYYYEHGGY